MQGEDGVATSAAGSGAEAQLGPPVARRSPYAAVAKGPARWEVIGGTKEGGIIVREGHLTTSTRLRDRLARGAIIEQQRLVGERLHYKKVLGLGPAHGWVSVTVGGNRILKKMQAEARKSAVDPAAAAAQAEAEALLLRQQSAAMEAAEEADEPPTTQASELFRGPDRSAQPKAREPNASECDEVLFSLERALSLQEDLIQGFSQPEVQDELTKLAETSSDRTVQFKKKQAELYFGVQSAVLPKYGFEATRVGIVAMMKALQAHQGPEVTANDERLNQLLRF